MTISVRFAPSPTGLLHIGNARMALVNWLYAKQHNGKMVLRLDDTDTERSTPEFAAAIEEDLEWLGLKWDRIERQSERLSAYDAAFEKLKTAGRVYPCYESPDELDYKRKRNMRAGKPPIYDRAALEISDEQVQAYIDEGRTPHWRFKLNHADIEFTDIVRGPVKFDGTHLSDPVIVRGNGTYLYMMPSCIDDIDMGITHVIRGEDHVTNSAIQIQMFEAMGAVAPTFAHLSLLTDASGGGLSKRHGSMSLGDMRRDGVEAMSINSLLAFLGTSDDIEPCHDLETLAGQFDIEHFGRAAAKFDPDRLWALNAKLLHTLDFADVEDELKALGISPLSADFWEAAKANVERLADCKEWHTVCYGDITPVKAEDDDEFFAEALNLLPAEPWDQQTWSAWTSAVKEATGRKGKNLFMPLRAVLTGLDHGPELKLLLPLIGREAVTKRLS